MDIAGIIHAVKEALKTLSLATDDDENRDEWRKRTRVADRSPWGLITT